MDVYLAQLFIVHLARWISISNPKHLRISQQLFAKICFAFHFTRASHTLETFEPSPDILLKVATLLRIPKRWVDMDLGQNKYSSFGAGTAIEKNRNSAEQFCIQFVLIFKISGLKFSTVEKNLESTERFLKLICLICAPSSVY